jgi:aspartate/methionine/tyrosine aminotransferase
VFSRRLPASLAPNPLTTAIARERDRGRDPIDLTATNPTTAGIGYPPNLLESLGSVDGATYAPEPFGAVATREFVASVLGAAFGATPHVDRLALTSSTSEAYAVLFKLLCDPGDEVLVPQPSYPLFEHLASLECVRVAPYQLDPHGGWTIDLDSVHAAWTPRTRAVIVVSPNNPTGSMLRARERDALESWCAGTGVALIVDEVFRWYPLSPSSDAVCPFVDREAPAALVFALDGLSKSCALPQVKLAWIEMAGPAALVGDAARRLEVVLDTFLSVGTPVQVALPRLWQDATPVRDAIRARVADNLDAARTLVASSDGCSLVVPEGGWSLVVRVPAIDSEESLALALLERDGVLVHPGYYFDFPHEAFLVLSLLPRPAEFREGLARVVRRCRIA